MFAGGRPKSREDLFTISAAPLVTTIMESSPNVLQVDLADLVVPKQVSVVQELDLGKLSATLRAIVDAVNSRAATGQDDAPTKGDFDALQKELEKLRQDVDGKDAEIKELKAEQVIYTPLPPSFLSCWIGLGILFATSIPHV